MKEELWVRHTNPRSLWTRDTALPILILSGWGRLGLSWWVVVPISLATLWMWLNPHFFSAPTSTDNWASKAVLGKRVWFGRKAIPVPRHHQIMIHLLSIVTGLGILFMTVGVIYYAMWPVILGMILFYAGRLWYLDRMVWLYEEMQNHPEYSPWLY